MKKLLVHQILHEEKCYEIIRKKLKQDALENYLIIAYEIIPINEVNGYMGQYYTLKAKAMSPETSLNAQSIDFFVKILPSTSSPLYEYAIEYGSFRKEVTLYTTVFPKLFEGITAKYIPKCFLGLEDQVIVLEDMSQYGYFMTNKFVPFDLEHCKILMETLAKFHAHSLIFEERYKKKLNKEYPNCLKESLWSLKGDKGIRMLNAAIKGTISIIEMIPDLSEDDVIRFKDKFISFVSNHASKLLPSTKYKNVICHGDLWANNVLYKYDENGKPLDCCIIDFQLSRYNPPAHDILCFLQFTTTPELRKNSALELYGVYYEAIVQSIGEAGIIAAKIFPWDEFMKSIEELQIVCMAHGVMNIPIMLLESNTADKYFSETPELLEKVLYVDRTPLICEQFKQFPAYRTRILNALLELYENLKRPLYN